MLIMIHCDPSKNYQSYATLAALCGTTQSNRRMFTGPNKPEKIVIPTYSLLQDTRYDAIGYNNKFFVPNATHRSEPGVVML